MLVGSRGADGARRGSGEGECRRQERGAGGACIGPRKNINKVESGPFCFL